MAMHAMHKVSLTQMHTPELMTANKNNVIAHVPGRYNPQEKTKVDMHTV
jgi:hypothetical protein